MFRLTIGVATASLGVLMALPAAAQANGIDCWSIHPCTQAQRHVIRKKPKAQRQRSYREPRDYYREPPQRERYDGFHRSDDAEQHCWPSLSVVGDAALTQDGAKAQAEQSWIREVRWRYGASFLDMRNAKDTRWRCGQSSVRRIGDIPLQQTCELVAKPCRAPLVSE